MSVRSGGVTDGSLGLPWGPYQSRWHLWGQERSSQGPGETPGLWEAGYLPVGPFALTYSLLVPPHLCSSCGCGAHSFLLSNADTHAHRQGRESISIWKFARRKRGEGMMWGPGTPVGSNS